MKKTLLALLALAILGGAVIAAPRHAANRRASKGFKKLGLKVYWSLLDTKQKEEAKEIITDHLATTGPDRLAVVARVLRYRADVAAVLTKKQRIGAWKLMRAVKRLSPEKRRHLVDKALSATDRGLLADRVGRIVDAAPEEQVTLGLAIHQQCFDVVMAKLGDRLSLTADQISKIEAHYAALRRDIHPVALRLAKAKAEAVAKGLALLNEEQRAKLEKVKAEVLPKILDFLRG